MKNFREKHSTICLIFAVSMSYLLLALEICPDGWYLLISKGDFISYTPQLKTGNMH